MVTPRQIEDLLRQCEQKRQITRGDESYLKRRFKCACGRVHHYVTDFYLCSASHDDGET